MTLLIHVTRILSLSLFCYQSAAFAQEPIQFIPPVQLDSPTESTASNSEVKSPDESKEQEEKNSNTLTQEDADIMLQELLRQSNHSTPGREDSDRIKRAQILAKLKEEMLEEQRRMRAANLARRKDDFSWMTLAKQTAAFATLGAAVGLAGLGIGDLEFFEDNEFFSQFGWKKAEEDFKQGLIDSSNRSLEKPRFQILNDAVLPALSESPNDKNISVVSTPDPIPDYKILYGWQLPEKNPEFLKSVWTHLHLKASEKADASTPASASAEATTPESDKITVEKISNHIVHILLPVSNEGHDEDNVFKGIIRRRAIIGAVIGGSIPLLRAVYRYVFPPKKQMMEDMESEKAFIIPEEETT